jgi:protein-L-isoaspartate(D-aspartate) O-methyltransferase
MSATDLVVRRRFFAEELEAVCGLRSPALVEAFASVPRERFLPPGPWDLLSVADYTPMAVPPPRKTPDDDPRRVYHNVGIAIDVSRRLFNGHPGTVAQWIDLLDLHAGAHVLHVGSGTGYYTGIIAHAVGARGRVVAIEVDDRLAAAARTNLADFPWVEVRQGDAAGGLDESFDAMLMNAGVTHPRDEWLDALCANGRLILPLTCAMSASDPIGKGVVMLVTRAGDQFDARPVTIVAIYSAIGLRDDALNRALGDAMRRQPFPPIMRLRRDRHEASDLCWVHGPTVCWSRTDRPA